MTLYELTGEYLSLLEMAEDENIDQKTLRDTMEAIGGELEDKADGYAKVIAQLAGDAESIKKQIERLTSMKDRIERNIVALKKNLEASMIAIGKRKFKTQLFSFNVQKNAPSLDLIDESMVPDMFRVPQPDKIDRRAALDFIKKNGETAWGKLKQTESLRIR